MLLDQEEGAGAYQNQQSELFLPPREFWRVLLNKPTLCVPLKATTETQLSPYITTQGQAEYIIQERIPLIYFNCPRLCACILRLPHTGIKTLRLGKLRTVHCRGHWVTSCQERGRSPSKHRLQSQTCSVSRGSASVHVRIVILMSSKKRNIYSDDIVHKRPLFPVHNISFERLHKITHLTFPSHFRKAKAWCSCRPVFLEPKSTLYCVRTCESLTLPNHLVP